jgi:hypothetical protein
LNAVAAVHLAIGAAKITGEGAEMAPRSPSTCRLGLENSGFTPDFKLATLKEV